MQHANAGLPACRPPSTSAILYNARRDNLTGFWKNVYAHTHAIVVADGFLEHVDRHKLEGRELAPGEEVEDVISSSPQGMAS